VVICGRNEKLMEKLNASTWSPEMNVVVKGFVDNMHQWMGASDCIITKAGPGTIAESLICGLPLLLNGFVPGQVCAQS
jgi:1,2-diacylglycerol 3-beta-galactosyltransferase